MVPPRKCQKCLQASDPKIIRVLRQDLSGPPRTQIGTIFADLATQTVPLLRPRRTWPWKTKLRFADAIASEDPGPSTSGAIYSCSAVVNEQQRQGFMGGLMKRSISVNKSLDKKSVHY